jgi:transposase
VTRIFHCQGLKLKRPRPKPAKGDESKQQVFFDDLRNKMQQASSADQFLFFDACSVQRSATITRMWWEASSQPEVKVCGGRERIHILGILNASNKQARFMFSPTLNAEGFIAFLTKLLSIYPKKNLHVLLDNAPAHHAKIVKKFVDAKGNRLELIFLPPYSPRLNPIERFWQFLRQEITHNTYFESFERFEAEITEFLKKFKVSNQKIAGLCQIYFKTGPIPVASL